MKINMDMTTEQTQRINELAAAVAPCNACGEDLTPDRMLIVQPQSYKNPVKHGTVDVAAICQMCAQAMIHTWMTLKRIGDKRAVRT